MSKIQTRKIASTQEALSNNNVGEAFKSYIGEEEDTLPEVNVNDTSSEDRLLDYVEKEIAKMRKYTSLGITGELTFFELNSALKNYSSINCSYVALDVMAKEEYQKAKNAFDDFISEKYIIIRNENNLPGLATGKWLSKEEIMYYVQTDKRWNDEFKRLRKEMQDGEKRVAFCRRLLDNLESYKYNVGTLCRNIQAEVANFASVRNFGMEQN